MLPAVLQYGPIIGAVLWILVAALARLVRGYSNIQVTRGWVALLKEEDAPAEKIHEVILQAAKRPRRGRPK